MGTAGVEGAVTSAFEGVGLLIGGLVATHDVPDEFVWRLMENLDALRRRTLDEIADRKTTRATSSSPRTFRSHPAIDRFLTEPDVREPTRRDPVRARDRPHGKSGS